MAKILLVEDDKDLCGRIQEWLCFERHSLEFVHDGAEAKERLKFYNYELVILDWDLPQLSGLEVCQDFRKQGGMTPILMLTGKEEIAAKEAGLDAGADDYLTKPFHLKELSARLRALLRRPSFVNTTLLTAGCLVLDPAKHQVSVNGKELSLLPKEYALLEFFMRHPTEIFSPEALLSRVWSSESEATADTIYTYMKTLRKKLKAFPGTPSIKTRHGIGYQLDIS